MLTTTLWAAQIILALFFLFAGLPKILGRGIDRWIGFDDVPRPLSVLIGIAEVAASVALVVPMLLGAFEWTTPLAAVGIAVMTLMASGFHTRAGGVREWACAVETALWATLGGAVAIGRWELLATGPALSPDLLVPAIGVLVVALVVNIALIFRMPASRAEARGTAAVRPDAAAPAAVRTAEETRA